MKLKVKLKQRVNNNIFVINIKLLPFRGDGHKQPTSTDDQTTALQLAALKKAGCTKIFEDKGVSGTIKKRPALTRCLAALKSGDTLTVWKLDRLGRSLRDLIDHLDELRGRGVRLQSITEDIDTETPTGRAMWQFVGVLAELADRKDSFVVRRDVV